MGALNVGGHLPLGRKPRETVRWAAENGFGCMQVFASSPGAWRPPAFEPGRVTEFLEARQEFEIDPLFIHSIYLINLASSDSALVGRSVQSLIDAMNTGALLGAAGVVTHIGSHGGRGYKEVAEDVGSALKQIIECTPDSVSLVLENSAGMANILGAQLGELGDLIRRSGSHSRLKVALDTAHLCGAGWDFQNSETTEQLQIELDQAIGADRLAVIHANDSGVPCGSRRDRHANIGTGYIGLEGFRHLAAVERFRQIPWILETPDLDRRVEDLTKLQALAVQPISMGVRHAS
jgi:deoxyribonuclease-4